MNSDQITPHIFANEYEFRGDGGDYTPTEGERALIEDAISEYLAVTAADNRFTAALAVQTQQGVEVKKLEWRNQGKTLFADTSFGGYQIDIGPYVGGPACHLLHGDSFLSPHASEESAKAAAQSDYETRIRSALVDVPAVESEPVALIEREVLAELAKHKTATGTVCSPLFKGKFGDKVPLFAHPPRSLSNEVELEEAGWQARYWMKAENRWSNWITNPLGHAWAYDEERIASGLTETRKLFALPTPPSPNGGDTGDGSAIITSGVRTDG